MTDKRYFKNDPRVKKLILIFRPYKCGFQDI